MIGLLLFLQAAAVALPIPDFVVVRDGATTVAVPVTIDGGAASVRADALMRAMRGTLITSTNLHYALSLAGMRLDLIDGIPFAKLDTLTIPLTRAPQVRGGVLYLPFQFVSELIPRYAGGYVFDQAKGELRTSVAVASTAPRAGVSKPSSAVDTGARPGASNRLGAGSSATTASSTIASATTRSGTTGSPTTGTPTTARATPDPAAIRSPARRSPPASHPATKPASERQLVVIDAGHGGPDNGMTGPIGSPTWFVEKDVTLSVAKKLASVLRARGVDVLMTRTTDTLIALHDRGKIANANHGDVFISIHCNAPGYSTAAAARERGFETYFLAEAKTEGERRVQDMENESVKFETGADASKGDPLSFIITDMAQNEHLRESNDLAQTIQNGLIEVHPGPNRGVQQADFAVLRGSYMPAVLVEIGFGSNQAEATYLSDQDNQRAIARNIGESVLAYLAHYESRVGGNR